jgi:hypothetical protein
MARQLFALLVGIDDYPAIKEFKLQGCVRDVGLFAEYLNEHVSREKTEDFKLRLEVLKDQEATRAKVIAGFRDHLAAAGSGDVALFYFAGHGSQQRTAPEFRYLEPDGLDETLVCWDSRKDGSWDLADKELAYLLAQVAENGAHLVIILDSCHSGSGTRALAPGTAQRVRRYAADDRPRKLTDYLFTPEQLKPFDFSGGGDDSGSGWLRLPRGRHVLLAACRSDQKAKEMGEGGTASGVFSAMLLDTLQSARGRLSYKDLFKRAAALVRARVGDQDPQLEATDNEDLNRDFLFGALRSPPPYFTVSCDKQLGWVIDGGTVHGILPPTATETTLLAVFPVECPADQMRDLDRARGRVEVLEVRLGRSTVRLVEGDELSRETTYKAVVVSWPLPPVSVFLEGDPTSVAAVRAALANPRPGHGGYVREVPDASQARLRLLARDFTYTIKRALEDRPMSAGLRGGAAAAHTAVERLEHISRWMTVTDLANKRSPLDPSEIELEIIQDGKGRQESPLRLRYEYRDGQWHEPTFRIRVRNRGQQRRYCALLNCSERYGISAGLFPGGGVWIEPGNSFMALDGNPVPAWIPEELLAEKVTEYGDWLVLIVSDEQFDATLIEQGPLGEMDRGRTRGEPPSGVLNRLMARVRTREIGRGPGGKRENWWATTVGFTTVKPLDYSPLPAPGRSFELIRGVSVEGHPSLLGQARLATRQQALDVLGAANDPLRVCDLPLREPFWFTQGRGADPGFSVLELARLTRPEAITQEQPLRLRLSGPLQVDGPVVALARDGEGCRAVGELVPAKEGAEARVWACPAPSPDPKAPVFLFFFRGAESGARAEQSSRP